MPLSTIPQLGHPKPAEGRLARRKPAALCLSDVKQGWMTWREHIKDIGDGRAESQPPEDCLAEDSVHLAGWWHRIARQYREAPFRQAEGPCADGRGLTKREQPLLASRDTSHKDSLILVGACSTPSRPLSSPATHGTNQVLACRDHVLHTVLAEMMPNQISTFDTSHLSRRSRLSTASNAATAPLRCISAEWTSTSVPSFRPMEQKVQMEMLSFLETSSATAVSPPSHRGSFPSRRL